MVQEEHLPPIKAIWVFMDAVQAATAEQEVKITAAMVMAETVFAAVEVMAAVAEQAR